MEGNRRVGGCEVAFSSAAIALGSSIAAHKRRVLDHTRYVCDGEEEVGGNRDDSKDDQEDNETAERRAARLAVKSRRFDAERIERKTQTKNTQVSFLAFFYTLQVMFLWQFASQGCKEALWGKDGGEIAS